MAEKDVEGVEGEERELPEGWIFSTISSALSDGVFCDGDWVESKDQDPTGEVRLVQLADIGIGDFRNKSDRYLNKQTATRLKCTPIYKNDVLIARMPDPLGRACVFPGDKKECVTVVDIAIARMGRKLNNQYFMYFCNAPETQKQMHQDSSGTTRKRISRGNLGFIPIPLPPLPEQERIAARLDLLLGRLKASRTRLDALPEILKRFRNSVLARAVSGKLTQEWRAEHAAELPTAEELLERVRAERRAAWEKAELEKLRSRGKEPKDDSWKAKYKEPEPADAGELGELPEGWAWSILEELSSYISSGSRNWAQLYSENGSMFIRVSNLNRNSIELNISETKFVDVSNASEGLRTSLQANDLLISITADLGMVGIVPKKLGEAFINQHLSIIRPLSVLNARFIAWVIASPIVGQKQITKKNKGMTKAGLTLDDVKLLFVPLPSLPEQAEIVRWVDELFAYVNALEERLEAARALAARLEPAILAKAFRGGLSEQVPEEAAEWERTLAALEEDAARLAATEGARRGRGRKSARDPETAVGGRAAAEKSAAAASRKRGRPRKGT